MSLSPEGASEGRRVGLVGYGRWGSVWARLLNEVGALAWIVDRDYDARLRAREEFVDTSIYEEPPVFDLPATTAVVVATPPDVRSEVVVPLLREGLLVLVEKPFALSVEEAEEMVSASREHSSRLIAGHTFLYSDHVRLALSWAKNRIGRIRHSRYTWTNVSTDREEDVLWNLGPHPLSIAGLLMDMRGVSVDPDTQEVVVGTATRRAERYDTLDLIRAGTDGSVESFHLANFGAEKVREFAIVGDGGSLVCRPTQGETIWTSPTGVQETRHDQGVEPLKRLLAYLLTSAPLEDENAASARRLVHHMVSLTEALKNASKKL